MYDVTELTFSNVIKPRCFEWSPKDDITAHELALCLSLILHGYKGDCGMIYDSLPENAKRHFVEK